MANWKINICVCVGVVFGTWLATALEMFETEAGVWGLSVRHINGAMQEDNQFLWGGSCTPPRSCSTIFS